MPRKNKGPQLAENDRGFYEIRWTEGGRSRRKTTGTKDFQLAQETLAHFILLKGDDEARQARADERLLVADAVGDPDEDDPDLEDYWHDHVLKKVKSIETATFAREKIVGHFGHLAVADLEPFHVKDYIRKRQRGEIGKPSKNATISRELTFLNAAINHAVKNKRMPRADQPFIQMPGGSPPKDRWLTAEEADALLAAALASEDPACPKGKLPRIYRFVALALHTAARSAAVRQLQRKQIKLDQGIILLNPEGREQTNKKRPPVPISDELRPILKRILLEIGPGDDAFLCTHDGAIRTAFKSARKRAGLGEDVTPHTLRHTRATWMAQAGVPMDKIAAILGDSVVTVTKNYIHHHPEYLRDAINAKPTKRSA